MANYDFGATLSPIDFELLVRDLLEAELRMPFENFKEGKDKGIDLRYAPAKVRLSSSNQVQSLIDAGNQLPTIVQCKRLASFSKLKHTLQNAELPKIQILNPGRYILATSVPLSPQQSDEICDVLSPFVLSTADVYGRERLNSLLTKYPDVERRNIKLWASSAGVLDAIVNARTHKVSREEVERTIAAAKLYVRNRSLDDALKILIDHRVCIIAGDPGIGKTTLARMLLLHYFDLEFDVIKIESDISEARFVGNHDRPKFYYYDDFLGQTSNLEKLNKNEDQKILDFMASIRDSKDSVFVLTTREYILNQAKLQYEKFDRERFDHRTCIVDLAKYSRRIRAEILYNHIYFSNLEREFVDELVAKRAYVRIVDHKNYSPRLIEVLTDRHWIGDTSVGNYLEKFFDNLDNPAEIWKHAFWSQLSDRSRHLLFVLVSMPAQTTVPYLENAFRSFHTSHCSRLGVRMNSSDFRFALKELEGTFVALRRITDETLIGFANPSIRDFMQLQIKGDMLLSDLIGSLEYFEQAQWFFESLTDPFSRISKRELEPYSVDIFDAAKRLFKSESCLVSTNGLAHAEAVWRRPIQVATRLETVLLSMMSSDRVADKEWITESISELSNAIANRSLEPSPFVELLVRLEDNGSFGSDVELELFQSVKMRVLEDPDTLDEFEGIASLNATFPKLFTDEELSHLRSGFIRATDTYLDECYGLSPEELRGEAARISEIGDLFEVHTDYTQDRFKERADEIEKDRPERKPEPRRPVTKVPNLCSDDDLDSMFGTL